MHKKYALRQKSNTKNYNYTKYTVSNDNIVAKTSFTTLPFSACSRNGNSTIHSGSVGGYRTSETPNTPKFRKQNTVKRLYKTISTLEQIVCNNFAIEQSSFITLTFSAQTRDLSYANNEVRTFVNVLKTRIERYYKNVPSQDIPYISFKYAYCLAYGKETDKLHAHIICNVINLSTNQIRKIWHHATCNVKLVTDVEGLSHYFSTNLYSFLSPVHINELINVKYVRIANWSNQLHRSKEICSWNRDHLKDINKLMKLENYGYIKRTSYSYNEYCGSIMYQDIYLSKRPYKFPLLKGIPYTKLRQLSKLNQKHK